MQLLNSKFNSSNMADAILKDTSPAFYYPRHNYLAQYSNELTTSVKTVFPITKKILQEVEAQDARFISSFVKLENQYECLEVISSKRFLAKLFLNHMGVLNFIDSGSLPGYAFLKLSDERKRSTSLWTEFITASGYLSAKKLRNKFHNLVTKAIIQAKLDDTVTVIEDAGSVILSINHEYIIEITLAFMCCGIWPRCASTWPHMYALWPCPDMVYQVREIGFHLLANGTQEKHTTLSSNESEAWCISFMEIEDKLLERGCRRLCLTILNYLRDTHLKLPGQPLQNYHMKTILLYECEKHPFEHEWMPDCIQDRLKGIFLQLVSCLQSRCCPHYFIPKINLLEGWPTAVLDIATKQAWRITRQIITNPDQLHQINQESIKT
ncbi:Protein mab-21-like 2 [Trichoplax sp. H2]|nr:Protein mab-21-like 2 [Trichoplax sp. H2]|eukprot:RDD38638.1 Protein mab-21-like 2 [Trichoplax sp. H2]